MSANGQHQTKNTGAAGNGFSESDIESNIGNTADAAIIWICDFNPKSFGRVRRTCPIVGVSTNPGEILNGLPKDAVSIVVPASHRFQL